MFKKSTNENYVKVWKLKFENQLTKNAKSLIIIGSSQEDTSMILDLKGNDFHFLATFYKLNLTHPIGLPPHAPVAQKIANQRWLIANSAKNRYIF